MGVKFLFLFVLSQNENRINSFSRKTRPTMFPLSVFFCYNYIGNKTLTVKDNNTNESGSDENEEIYIKDK